MSEEEGWLKEQLGTAALAPLQKSITSRLFYLISYGSSNHDELLTLCSV